MVEEPAGTYGTPYTVSRVLGVEPEGLREPMMRIRTLRKGLDRSSFERLKSVTGLDYARLAEALSVSAKTLQRKDVFDVVQSEKMYELAELYAVGMAYFGVEGFRVWMERPLFSLGNAKPIDLIDLTEGIRLVKTEVLKVQHGIAV